MQNSDLTSLGFSDAQATKLMQDKHFLTYIVNPVIFKARFESMVSIYSDKDAVMKAILSHPPFAGLTHSPPAIAWPSPPRYGGENGVSTHTFRPVILDAPQEPAPIFA